MCAGSSGLLFLHPASLFIEGNPIADYLLILLLPIPGIPFLIDLLQGFFAIPLHILQRSRPLYLPHSDAGPALFCPKKKDAAPAKNPLDSRPFCSIPIHIRRYKRKQSSSAAWYLSLSARNSFFNSVSSSSL